jgi:hypothetical protein
MFVGMPQCSTNGKRGKIKVAMARFEFAAGTIRDRR